MTPKRDRLERTLMVTFGIATVEAIANDAFEARTAAQDRANVEVQRAYLVSCGETR